MEGVTNSIYRKAIIDLDAVDIVATEFIRITGEKQTISDIVRYKKPLQIQVMGSSGKTISSCIEYLKSKNKLLENDLLDLNVGCPSKRVNSSGAGAALLKDPGELAKIVSNIRKVHKGIFSIKTRIGFQSGESFNEILELLKDCELDFITIHCRSCSGKYTEKVNYEYLELASSKLPYPVIGNGDIWGVAEAKKVLDCGVKGLMCGRGAIINPFLFNELRAFLDKKHFTVTKDQLRNFCLTLLDTYLEEQKNTKKNYIGVFKEFSVWFSKNPLIGREFFDSVKLCQSLEEVREKI